MDEKTLRVLVDRNYDAIVRVETKLDGKVGRGEVFGWLGVFGVVLGALILVL